MPDLLEQLANTPELKRLSNVGMHCGCEYASLPLYAHSKPYSRLTHSIGVAKIIWHFTKDITQSAAGMLHDIATPVFAHTIDFMNNDHMAQESTENNTVSFIANSKSIMRLLDKNNIHIDNISDYKKYTIADNDTPMLSADRLEYTLGNGYTVYNLSLSRLKEIYEDLTIAENELGYEELCFRSANKAKAFVEISLKNSYFFVSNEDRFLMEYLAKIMRRAIEIGVITLDDLYLTEKDVIKSLVKSEELSEEWSKFTNISAVSASNEKLHDRYCVKVSAKKRYIDPLVLTEGGIKRITEIDADLKTQIEEFQNLDFNHWIYAV